MNRVLNKTSDFCDSRVVRAAAPSGLELFFDSLTQGGTAFALGYCLSGFQPLAATTRSRSLLRLDSCSLAFIRG